MRKIKKFGAEKSVLLKTADVNGDAALEKMRAFRFGN